MMTDWREHNGGPQPVDDETWVEIDEGHIDHDCGAARLFDWNREEWFRWNVINQHLIRAARLEGFRLGLEAAHKAIMALDYVVDEAERSVLEDASMAVRALNPDTIALDVQTSSHQAKCDDLHIAREAVLDQLTREAQEQDMGYAQEADRD